MVQGIPTPNVSNVGVEEIVDTRNHDVVIEKKTEARVENYENFEKD